MLAVASPPLSLDHDQRPTSPVFQSPVHNSVFGALQPNGALHTIDDLLKQPVEFKQGCLTPSSGVLTAGIAEHKYKPINDEPPSEDEDDSPIAKESASPPSPPKQSPATGTLFPGKLTMDWPAQATRHPGFNNHGNTCFLNSVLQCLLHTPPLLHALFDHKHTKVNFCMVCLLRDLACASFINRKRNTSIVLTNLNKIAKGMRQGRQEDAHEFLRYSVDALQRSALAIHSSTSPTHPNPSKIPPALAETSWVHAIFGGRLRSRVSCRSCHHCSDTFDSLLDLSVEIVQVQSLIRALAQFVKPEILSGEDAYRCEKCKKPVTAEKFMTVHEAPVCLTIHLKRFTPTGRKIMNPIAYPEILDLQQYMSKGQPSKRYMLYGVIHHFGSGPNSGHYTAHVKGADGRWTMMDDDIVTPCSGPPVNHKNAYVLFYIQTNKSQPTSSDGSEDVFRGLGGQKRARDEMESNNSRSGWKSSGLQIRTTPWDPFPITKKTRVEDTSRPKQGVAGPSRPAAVGVPSALSQSLVGYGDSDDIGDVGEVVNSTSNKPTSPTISSTRSAEENTAAEIIRAVTPPIRSTPQPKSSPALAARTFKQFSPTKPSSFYGTLKKDKRPGASPYGSLAGSGNLHAKKDSNAKELEKQLQMNMGFAQFSGGPKVKNRMKGKKSSP